MKSTTKSFLYSNLGVKQTSTTIVQYQFCRLSQITECVVHNQVYDYLERNKLLSQYQLGFRKQRSTTHAVTYYTDYIRNQMDKGHLTGSLYIDLRKAFDTVNHGRLLAKLQLYGIEEQELLCCGWRVICLDDIRVSALKTLFPPATL